MFRKPLAVRIGVKLTTSITNTNLSDGLAIFCRNASCPISSEKLWMAFRNCLYKKCDEQEIQPGNKVSIIGSGAVGASCAMSLLSKGVTNNLAIYDDDQTLCHAESLDLLHGSLFLNNCQIEQSCDINSTKDSRVVVVTTEGIFTSCDSREQVAKKSANIIRCLMPQLVKLSPKAVFIVVSHPADVMAWMARKVTGLPYERCFSTGCHLDTARFRTLIAKMVGVAPTSVHGYVLGERGLSSVPMWSSVAVGGVSLQKLIPEIGTKYDGMGWAKVHEEVVNAAYKVMAGKGYTNWAIGLTAADVVSAIFEDSNRILSLSTNAKGMCGIKDEVFLSLPCIVNKWGLFGVVRPTLTKWEEAEIRKTADELLKAQCSLEI